jgi:hypothetical protein
MMKGVMQKFGWNMRGARLGLIAITALSVAACSGGGMSLPRTATALPVVDPAAQAEVPAAAPSTPAAAPEAPQPQAAAAAAPVVEKKPAEWGALFIAGDNSITAFDNATRRFYSILDDRKTVTLRRLTSDPAIAPSQEDIADLGPIDDALRFVTKSQQEKCLVFMTSHGTQDGFYLSQAGGTGGLLPPNVLDQWLDNHCGVRPTVVIVSACYSGIFLEQGMAQPNRIILTAARADRPSFGCGAGETYTYFDKCLLDSWTWVYTWAELYDRTKSCVAEREAEMDAKPSDPQAYFGAEVATLPMP